MWQLVDGVSKLVWNNDTECYHWGVTPMYTTVNWPLVRVKCFRYLIKRLINKLCILVIWNAFGGQVLYSPRVFHILLPVCASLKPISMHVYHLYTRWSMHISRRGIVFLVRRAWYKKLWWLKYACVIHMDLKCFKNVWVVKYLLRLKSTIKSCIPTHRHWITNRQTHVFKCQSIQLYCECSPLKMKCYALPWTHRFGVSNNYWYLND